MAYDSSHSNDLFRWLAGMNPLSISAFASSPERRARWLIFGGVCAVALAFAAYTQHAWEDYYITYRCSKNLATGQGLVYTVGERVHAFTSPLNVLLPAALSIMTGNRSDELVLWLFRGVSTLLLAGAAVLLLDSARKNSLGRIPAALLVGMFGLDAKIVDFSINGQEAAFMAFFLALALHALTVRSNRTILRLGLAGAGLMWTRPDGFIYLGAVVVGFLLFNAGRPIGHSRSGLLKVFLCAGALTTVLYLPWLLWAWHYYGSPVPHTIIAKSLIRNGFPLKPGRLLHDLLTFPWGMVRGTTSAETTFLPTYALSFDGWPRTVTLYGQCLAYTCALYWLLPFARAQARAASFAFMLSHFYLSSIAAYPAPWYVPTSATLAVFVFAHIAQHGLDLARSLKLKGCKGSRLVTAGVQGLAAAVLSATLLLLLCSAYQMRAQQQLVEEGNRKPIGLWLRRHAASPSDTVYLEPLGYIGFFSQLKMLDSPGLCAPEVVAIEKRLGSTSGIDVIPELQPDWLVLRPAETDGIHAASPRLLTKAYSAVQFFDVSERLAAYRWLPGRGYLRYDEKFIVFKRNPPSRAADLGRH